MTRRVLLGYQLLTGIMDTSTGLLLIVAPELTLRLMRLQTSVNALPYLSFVGVFVLAVGIACLYGAWLARPINPEPRLEVVWLLTAITRGLVAIFVASKIVLGALEPGWTMVAVADGALAMLQMIGLSRGWLADAADIEQPSRDGEASA